MDLITAGTVYAGSKLLLGKTFDVVSEDIAKLYEKGRDAIIQAAARKVPHMDDGRTANLRVARDIFWNGSFTDEAICAEYFGGILAASRSDDGNDDAGIYYADLIKSLSSKQLKLHYLFYTCLNNLLVSDPTKADINPGQEEQISPEKVCLSTREIQTLVGEDDIGRELHALHAKGLIGDFKSQGHLLSDGRTVPYCEIAPTVLGIQLYAVAHNKLASWRNFTKNDFGEFESIVLPKFFGQNLDKFLEKTGLNSTNSSISA